MTFTIDPHIETTCITLADWPLSRIFLKNNANYPWFILVPRVENVQEMDELSSDAQKQLMNEMTQLLRIVRDYFKPDKLNMGALGNLVPQLHIHIIARFKHDPLWPHGIWQEGQTTRPYDPSELEKIGHDLRPRWGIFF
jgi:diadenosine tetraphosphate (Ap4A) HIT family hydrolase